MSLDLTPEQQGTIEQAIASGLVGSVAEFIHSAMDLLRRDAASFNEEKARQAGDRIRELRRGVRIDLKATSFRELAHTGHRY